MNATFAERAYDHIVTVNSCAVICGRGHLLDRKQIAEDLRHQPDSGIRTPCSD